MRHEHGPVVVRADDAVWDSHVGLGFKAQHPLIFYVRLGYEQKVHLAQYIPRLLAM